MKEMTEPEREGRAARSVTPRRLLAEVAARPAAFDAVSEILEEDGGRLSALVALRHARMATDPFAFLRGSASLMARDLARGPSSPLEVVLCGDAHGANFGVFTSPEGRRVFDITDFDETAPGPFEWDLKRLAVSLVVVAGMGGAGSKARREVARDLARAYQRSMRRFARQRRLEVWYAALDLDEALADLSGTMGEGPAEASDRVLESASGPSRRQAYRHLVVEEEAGPRLRHLAPLLTPVEAVTGEGVLDRADLDQVLDLYPATLTSDRRTLLSQFRRLDAAHLVRGVGSVGTQCFAVLLAGRDEEDLFILQVKEARPSVLDVARGRGGGIEPGERVVTGQRLLQATPDELLGWHTRRVDGRAKSFYVRQYFDHKASVDLTRLDERQLRAYGRACAWTLARAHARGGSAGQIAGYLGSGEASVEAIADFAERYRDQVLADYRAFLEGVREARVTVEA